MRVAGFGFRSDARLDSLLSALDAAGGGAGITAIVTVREKADSSVFRALAVHLDLPVETVAKEALAWTVVETQSEKSRVMYGTGSLSEAVALIAAGPKARLISPRRISPDRMATCAIAESER